MGVRFRQGCWLGLVWCLATSWAWAAPEATTPDRKPLFQEELDRLQAGVPFAKLVLLDTTDPMYRSYVAAGLLHVDDAALEHLQSGLASVAVDHGQVDGRAQPVCYVLFQADHAQHIEAHFIEPIAQVADVRNAAAYLMGHEVGHCLDQFERTTELGQKMVWASSEVAALGLAPVAVERLFGPTMATATYVARKPELYRDNAQRQYEERVADAFGMAWVWRLGGPQSVMTVVRQARAVEQPWDAHATAPILDALTRDKDAVANTQSVQDVWTLARRLQLATGVDPSLGPGSEHVLNPVAHWLDSKNGGPVAQPLSPTSAAPNGLGRSFQDLPRFGGEPQHP